MDVKLPPRANQKANHRSKENRLETDPVLCVLVQHLALLAVFHLFIEHHEGHRVEVDIVT